MTLELLKYNKVIFYGAGDIAQMLYGELLKRRVNIDACVVTDIEKNGKSFLGKVPVYQVDECVSMLREKGTIILIAVTNKFVQQIEKILYDLNIKNYLIYSAFFKKNKKPLLQEYKDKTNETCIMEVLEWYMEDSNEDYKNFVEIKKNLEKKISNKGKNKNKIVIAVGDLSPRAIKIIKALHNAGKQVKVIIYPYALIREICKKELNELKVPYYESACIEEFIYDIIQEQPHIIHVFSCSINTVIPFILIKMKAIMPNIVYDEYDIINEFYHNKRIDRLEEERYCLEHADGVCNRGYELEYLSQQCGYHFQGKRIQFFDYCRDEDLIEKSNDLSEPLSICYAGGVITEKEYPDSSMACWIELAQKCAEGKCHLHVYPTEWKEEQYSEYIELEKKNKYFHFHHPVPSEILKQELSQYDYGIHPIKSRFLQQKINGFYKDIKMIYGVTNHFFDNLDAGIPTIAAAPILFAKFFEEKEVLIPWTIEEYDFDELRNRKKEYTQRVMKVQMELQINRHIYKLEEFYDSL